MHYRGSRGKGSGIFGKILRDNDGKVLLPAGVATTSKDLSQEVRSQRGEEDLGLAHEAVVAKIGG